MPKLNLILRSVYLAGATDYSVRMETIEKAYKAILDLIPSEKKSPKGINCKCSAHYYGECCCGVSWEDNDAWNSFRTELLKRLEG